MIGPDAAELRVLGALIEKQHTTPDAYPLSLNALRLATNQSTGRDPVVDYHEEEIREAMSGNVCRCTGYQGIVRAIQRAAQIKAGSEKLA